MATITVRSFAVKDSVSVKIQLRHKFERKQIHLFSVPAKDWNHEKKQVKKSNSDYSKLNLIISQKCHFYQSVIDELSLLFGKNFTLDQVLNSENKSGLISDKIDSYSKTQSISGSRKYKNLAAKVKNYFDAPINSIDESYMKGFVLSLKKDKMIQSQVTIHRYVNFLKTVLRASGVTDPKVINFKVSKGSGKKEVLTRSELLAFSKVDDYQLSRDSFLLSFYMYGTRIGDTLQLRKENIQGEKITFVEQKTRKTKMVLLNEKLMSIIIRYKGQSNHGYVLPILEKKWKDPKTNYQFQKHIHAKTAQINRDLKVISALAGIKKKITTHVARHTFASLGVESDINIRLLQKMMNFSSLSIMEQYLDELKKRGEMEEAMEKILKSGPPYNSQ